MYKSYIPIEPSLSTKNLAYCLSFETLHNEEISNIGSMY